MLFVNKILSLILGKKIKQVSSDRIVEENKENNYFLYTLEAQSCFKNRGKDYSRGRYPVTGIYRYTKNIINIYKDSKNGYPYAKLWLTKIKKHQFNLEKKFIKNESWLSQSTDGCNDLCIEEIKKDISPEGFNFFAKNPYARRQADFIKRYDEYLLLSRSALKKELIGENDHKKRCTWLYRDIRKIHNTSVYYTPIPCTNEDVVKKTELYYQARKKMGDIAK